MQLKEAEVNGVIFAPENSPDLSNSFYGFTDLESNGDYVISCEDKNADSWCDYEILFERAAAGANTSTNVFYLIRRRVNLSIRNYSAVRTWNMTKIKT
ncbi:MAG: hypothetical protein IPL22_21480 [Bacteroidetes bacterium]|nr:hypothetical protein [Bacteroidota bacterium]